jgi:hypothetical protein
MKYEFRRMAPFKQLTDEQLKEGTDRMMTRALAGISEIPILKAVVEADSPEEAKTKVKDAEWTEDMMTVRLG